MAKIYIDKQEYQVSDGQNLLQACLSLKIDLPYFCWHPSMGSVGACRQCAMTQYQDENDQRGRLIVACMTPVTEGMHLSMNQPAETEFRDQVISALMTHHPHDCPVCAEGGECHLQDMTVMTGHHARHYQGQKTTFTNQELGPLIKHEMNRCITCYRCVRFYQDYAGGTDLAAQASKNHVYFGRQCDGTLQSEFSGNLVEVCPTGVFTDKPFGDHYSRKWDMQTAPSVCQHCSVGCNISLWERYGSVRRVTNRLNDHLNGYFLCDRGRFGFGFVNSAERCSEIRYKGVQVEWQHEELQQTLNDPGRWIGIGSSQASLEDNFALQQLVGAENFCLTLDATEEALLLTHCDIASKHTLASVAEIESADAVIILAEDIANTAPRIALAIRQALSSLARQRAESLRIPAWQDAAVRQLMPHNKVPFFVVGFGDSALSELATQRITCDEQQSAAFAQRLTDTLKGDSSAEQVLHLTQNVASETFSDIAKVLKHASKPLVVSGWSAGSTMLIKAAANLKTALNNEQSMLCLAPSEANSMGLGLLAQQGYLPNNQLTDVMAFEPCNLLVLDHAGSLYRKQLSEIHSNARNLVRLSQLGQLKDDEVNLPLAAFSECSGSLVNYQGLVQSYLPVTKSTGQCLPAWQWLVNIARNHHQILGDVSNLDELRRAICLQHPQITEQWTVAHDHQLAMQTPRSSGRTAMLANQTVHEPKPFAEDNAPYKQSMEGSVSGTEKSAPIPYSWAPGWNSNQANHKFKDEFRSAALSAQQGPWGFTAKGGSDVYPWVDVAHSSNQTAIRILRLQRVFGSDSLSLQSLPVQQMSQQAQVYISPEQAAMWELKQGQYACCDDDTTLLSVVISLHVPKNTVLIYVPADHLFNIQHCQALVAATDEQLTLFAELNKLRQQHLKEHTRIQKQRLLSQDETIPIRFIEGAGP